MYPFDQQCRDKHCLSAVLRSRPQGPGLPARKFIVHSMAFSAAISFRFSDSGK